MARIQLRPGPPIIQHLLHSLKFFFKETAFPKTASLPFYIAITCIYCAIWITAVIVGPITYGSLFIIFAIYAIYKIIEHNAGSSSGSPYGKLSCVRAVMSAAAEIPLFTLLAIVYIQTGTMNIGDIITYQSVNGPLIFTIPLAAAMFLLIIISKSPNSPFSITKGKDIVSGFETEHFGVLRGFMMLSESIAWYMLLWVFLTIFFGPLTVLAYLVGMIAVTVFSAFINAITPILNPNHSVMFQISVAILGFVGSILLMVI